MVWTPNNGSPLRPREPGGGLLHSAADFVDHGRAELDDVKRLQHRGGVLELLVDRGLVAAERIQGCHLEPGPERLAALVQPVGVGLFRPARDQVQQAGVDTPVRIAGELDHPG